MLLSSAGLVSTLAWIAFGQNSEGSNYLSMSILRRLHRRSFGIDKSCDPTFYNRRNLLSMLGLKFILVSKRGPLGIWNRNQIGKAIHGF